MPPLPPKPKKCPAKIVAQGMLREGTPIEDYREYYGLFVKREDLACPPPGPPFSKTRGVYAHVRKQSANIIGVLDTYHSQAGHAVARACQVLGKQCVNYYPEFKHEPGPRSPQLRAQELGAQLIGIPAGRSAILFHKAKKLTLELGGYMMPNALKLEESVEETDKEVPVPLMGYAPDWVIVPASSGTIASGVIRGFECKGYRPHYLIHLGYSRSAEEVRKYLFKSADLSNQIPASLINSNYFSDLHDRITIIDEGYQYKDQAKYGAGQPPWPSNSYYDLKAFYWWMNNRERFPGEVLFWNIG